MSDSLNLSINISAIDVASSVIKGVGSAISDLASGNVIGAAVAVGTALVGVAVAATQMAAQYQQSMNKVQALTGASSDQMSQYDSMLKQLAMDTGVAPQQLSEGLYNVVSAGYQSQNAMTLLGLATKDSVIGMTDASTTTKSLTALLAQFSLGAADANRVNGEMLETVTLGSGTFEQYSSSIVKSASAAAQFHVPMETMNAAYATLTSSQISAAQASTDFQQSLKVMDGNIGTVAKSLNQSGIAFDETKFNAMDYGHQIVYLNSALDEANAKHVKVTGVTLQAAQAIQTIAQHINTYNTDLSTLSDKQAMAAKTQEAWAVTQQGFNVSMQRLQATAQVVMIDIGQKLLPIATGGVNLLNAAFQGLMSAGAYVGNVLRSLDLSGVAAEWNMISVEVSYAAEKIGGFISSLLPLKGSIDTVASAISGFAQGGLNILANLLREVSYAFGDINIAADSGKGPIAAIGAAFRQVGAILSGTLKSDLQWVGSTFNQIGGWIKSSLMPALLTLVPPIMSIAATIATNFLPAWAEIVAAVHQVIETMITLRIGVLEAIIPPVIFLAGWLLGGLAAGFKFVAPLVLGLANVILGLVNFFTKTQIGGDLLKATLIALSIPVGILAIAFLALAVEAIAGFIMSIPAMVAGFIAGAAGAWTMAMGVLALTWPILAVIAVIALIILAIQHWGDIVGWLKIAWGAIATFFVKLWDGILTGLKAAWNAIVTVVKVGAMLLLAAAFAPFIAIGALFVWLYNHNYYFKALIDAIVNAVKAGLAWLVAQWQGFTAWLGMLWQSIVGIATTVWNDITGAIKIAWNAVVAIVTSVWQTISGIFSSAYNTYIAGPLKAAWNYVSGVFMSAWNTYISPGLTAAWNFVSKWFTTLGTGALNAGVNFVKMLVSGITSGAGWLWNAVVNLATSLWKALGFHSPAEEGPGADADKWMPNLVSMLSTGLIAGVPKIQAAVNVVAKPLAALGSPVASGVSSPVAAPASASSAQGGAPVFNITITAPALSNREGKVLADEIEKHLSQKLRASGNMITWTSGGKRA